MRDLRQQLEILVLGEAPDVDTYGYGAADDDNCWYDDDYWQLVGPMLFGTGGAVGGGAGYGVAGTGCGVAVAGEGCGVVDAG
jgi:hypothetical protein